MSWSDLLPLIITGLLSGGGAAFVTVIVKGRSESRSIDTATEAARAKMPGEVDSVAIQNAEHALKMQQAVNESLVAENARLVAESARKDAHIVSLETTIEGLRTDLAEANDFGQQMARKLADASERYATLQQEMADYRAASPDPDPRP